jgi:hypothetical protein
VVEIAVRPGMTGYRLKQSDLYFLRRTTSFTGFANKHDGLVGAMKNAPGGYTA